MCIRDSNTALGKFSETGFNFKRKTFKTTIEGERNKKERKILINELINKAQTITSAIPNFLVVSDEAEEKVEDIFKTKDKEMFFNICGVNIEDFKYLVESGFINKYKMNKAIESFHLMEKF